MLERNKESDGEGHAWAGQYAVYVAVTLCTSAAATLRCWQAWGMTFVMFVDLPNEYLLLTRFAGNLFLINIKVVDRGRMRGG